jgi:Zn-dependent membrane protease YugP
MSRAKQILILVIIAAAVVAGMAIKMNLTSTSSVQANQGAGGRSTDVGILRDHQGFR